MTSSLRSPRIAGFTLLELLLAITLLGLIAVLLAGGVRLGARVWESGDVRAEEIARLEVVQTFLRRHLNQAVALRPPRTRRLVRRDDATGRPARVRGSFEGDGESLRFAAPAPPQFGIGGFYVMTLELEEADEGQRLVLSARPYHPEMEERPRDDEDVRESVLLKGVDDVEFSYFGSLRRREEPQWRDRWEGTRALPRLVRIHLDFADERRYWPEFVAAVRTAR
jgi:general secretion pathway protein J